MLCGTIWCADADQCFCVGYPGYAYPYGVNRIRDFPAEILDCARAAGALCPNILKNKHPWLILEDQVLEFPVHT